ncbi:glycosyltransferase family 4 protein [Roseateles sp. 22389]|uniref:glycosyltransferase family 4 protein n=1 Tax=Roseateles sp. 22389 TaxID=3453916 RepID=UPI003F834AB4
MRILITTSTFPPQSGGVAEVAARQVAALRGMGHEVKVLSGGDPQATDAEEGVQRLPIRPGRFPCYAAGDALGIHDPARRAVYLDAVRAARADVIVSHCWQAWNTDWLFDAQPAIETPIVLFSHGTSVNTKNGRTGLLRYVRWRSYAWRRIPRSLRSASAFVALADHADSDRFLDVSIARRIGVPVHVVANGSSEDVRAAADASPGRERLVLCVGQYTPEKNFAGVLDAFLHAGRKDWAIAFCGSSANGYLERLRQRVAGSLEAQEGRVAFHVGLGRRELAALYAKASIFAFASRTECQPLVVLDAMAAGMPFLSTDVGCVRTFPGGLTVPDNSVFETELVRLMADASLRERLGDEGRAAAERTYNWRVSAARLEQILSQVVANVQRAAGANS